MLAETAVLKLEGSCSLEGQRWQTCTMFTLSQVCSTLCEPVDDSPPGSSATGIFQARISECDLPSSRDLPNPGIKPRSPKLQVDSLLSEPPGKPMNTGVGSLSLLQGNFSAQVLNPDLLHCRQILYSLSHQGSPWILERVAYPFSRGTFWPRNWIRVSCIAEGFFISWATREAQKFLGI